MVRWTTFALRPEAPIATASSLSASATSSGNDATHATPRVASSCSARNSRTTGTALFPPLTIALVSSRPPFRNDVWRTLFGDGAKRDSSILESRTKVCTAHELPSFVSVYDVGHSSLTGTVEGSGSARATSSQDRVCVSGSGTTLMCQAPLAVPGTAAVDANAESVAAASRRRDPGVGPLISTPGISAHGAVVGEVGRTAMGRECDVHESAAL